MPVVQVDLCVIQAEPFRNTKEHWVTSHEARQQLLQRRLLGEDQVSQAWNVVSSIALSCYPQLTAIEFWVHLQESVEENKVVLSSGGVVGHVVSSLERKANTCGSFNPQHVSYVGPSIRVGFQAVRRDAEGSVLSGQPTQSRATRSYNQFQSSNKVKELCPPP